MAALTAMAVDAMTRLIRSFQELPFKITRNAREANQSREEPGLPMHSMDETGLRNRTGATASSSNHNEEGSSPTTSTTNTGTFTPGSGDDSSPPEDIRRTDSFVKTTWRQLSNRFDSSLFSRESVDKGDLNHIRGYDKFILENFEDYPDGLPRLAVLVASDDELGIFRGFKHCHTRVLNQLQIQITEMEKELLVLDKSDVGNPHTKHRLRRTKHKDGWDNTLNERIEELRVKLNQYDELALNHSRMQALGKPPERNYLSYYNWIWKTKPLTKGYDDFIFHKEDFLAVVPQKSNFFQDEIRDYMHNKPNSNLRKFFKVKDERESERTPAESFTRYSPGTLQRTSRVLLIAVVVGLILTPVFLLLLVPMSNVNMAITVASFTLLFLIIFSGVRGVKDSEVVVASATYGALLTVFLGNLGGSCSCAK